MTQSLWIFQLSHEADAVAGEHLASALRNTLQHWKSHQDPVRSSVQFRERRFIIVESFSDTSGCSKDFLRKEVHKLCNDAGYALDEASVIAYRADGEKVATLPMPEFITALREGIVSADTLIYDLTVVHQNTLEGWMKPVRDSWLARYLPVSTVST